MWGRYSTQLFSHTRCMEGGGYNVKRKTSHSRLWEVGRRAAKQPWLPEISVKSVRREAMPALSGCLFGIMGQGQLPGGLHHNTGHRYSNPVLQKDWQKRTWGLGFLSSHSSHKARTLSDYKRVKWTVHAGQTQGCVTYGNQGEAQSARVLLGSD